MRLRLCHAACFYLAPWIFLLLISLTHTSYAQKFNAFLVGGFNVAQLEGDNLSGFNKLGVNTGIRLEYSLDSKKGLATELLYHQKGSSSTLRAGTPSNVETISLNYIALPLYYFFNEWKDDSDEFYKFQIDIGLITNRLVSVKSSNIFFNNATEDFNNWDFGATVGLAYRFSKLWSFGLHYERSFTKIYQLPNSDLRGLQSYLMNFRLLYFL